MLQAKECRKEQSTCQCSRLLPRQYQGKDQDTVQKAIILEMDMVDNHETWREKDGEGCSMRRTLEAGWGRLDEPEGSA